MLALRDDGGLGAAGWYGAWRPPYWPACRTVFCVDPYEWVISTNLHRRHLTESQRALVAAKMVNVVVGENQHTKKRRQKEGGPIGPPSITNEDAAKKLSVGLGSVKRAKAVLENGCKELIEAVEKNVVKVSLAAQNAAKAERPHSTQ